MEQIETTLETAESVMDSALATVQSADITQVLTKAGIGILGVFAVTAVIIFSIWLLNKFTSKKDKKDGE